MLILVSGALLGAQPAMAQDGGISKKQMEKKLAKQKQEDKKSQKKAEKQNRARHLKIQDKPTRKRIKRNTRLTKKTGQTGHRKPFYQRWFTKNH